MAKKYKILVSNQAAQQLREIYEYIYYEIKSPHNAKNVTNKIKEDLYKLEYFPYRNRELSEFKNLNLHLRRLISKNYYAYYLIDETNTTVIISSVIYKSRNQLKQIINKKDA